MPAFSILISEPPAVGIDNISAAPVPYLTLIGLAAETFTAALFAFPDTDVDTP